MIDRQACEDYEFRRPSRNRKMAQPTVPEKRLMSVIEKNNLPFIYTGDGSVKVGNLYPDFVSCDGSRRVIEVFGGYWHDKKHGRFSGTENGRKALYGLQNRKCEVFWTRDLKAMPDDEIVRRLTHGYNI